MARGSRVRTLGALALVAGFTLSGCAINPATGKNQLMLVSQNEGIAMGRQADTAIIATIGLYPDAALQSYIQEFGARLAATSERPDLPWTFRVVDDPAVNAFAVPGGFVYVMRFQLTFPDGWATQNGKQAVIAVSPGQDGAIELAAAPEARADAAASAFLAQQGITAGATSRASVHALSTVSAPFVAETSGGTVQGMALFVEYRGGVFALIGYAPQARWSAYKTVVEGTLHSFQALTDPAALNVQPQRVAIVKLAARTTIAALARQRASPVSAETLALINQVALDTSLEAGRLVKWVVGPAALATRSPQNTAGR